MIASCFKFFPKSVRKFSFFISLIMTSSYILSVSIDLIFLNYQNLIYTCVATANPIFTDKSVWNFKFFEFPILGQSTDTKGRTKLIISSVFFWNPRWRGGGGEITLINRPIGLKFPPSHCCHCLSESTFHRENLKLLPALLSVSGGTMYWCTSNMMKSWNVHWIK